MKVRCISNHGKDLRSYEYEQIDKNVFGRFGASAHAQYGIEIGQDGNYYLSDLSSLLD